MMTADDACDTMNAFSYIAAGAGGTDAFAPGKPLDKATNQYKYYRHTQLKLESFCKKLRGRAAIHRAPFVSAMPRTGAGCPVEAADGFHLEGRKSRIAAAISAA
jgi:hypothetical protein